MPARVDPLSFRRRLRRASTDAELVLWSLVRRHALGPRFRRQHAVGPYTLDFYCPDAGLCVELDGGGHYCGDGPARDAVRDAYLASRGLRVLRFTDRDLLLEPELVREVLWRAVHPEAAVCAPPSPRPAPPAGWRGEDREGAQP